MLDFTNLVQTNLARRIERLIGPLGHRQPTSPALVLVGYGSAEFDREWTGFFTKIARYAEAELGIAEAAWAWCGHLVDYSRRPTIQAIDGLLDRHESVLVIPVLVARDPMFHERIIGRAVEQCARPERVRYSNDAILPEPDVGRWVISIVREILMTTPSNA